jgi:hypothetical protein
MKDARRKRMIDSPDSLAAGSWGQGSGRWWSFLLISGVVQINRVICTAGRRACSRSRDTCLTEEKQMHPKTQNLSTDLQRTTWNRRRGRNDGTENRRRTRNNGMQYRGNNGDI